MAKSVKARPRKGTQYTPRNQEQRSYFLPPGLGDLFRDFGTAGRGSASANARGAMVLFMACEDFPALRERAVRAADQLEPRAAVEDVKARLLETFGEELMKQYIQSLPNAEKGKLMKKALDQRARK
jgi:hypothetical protein